MSHMMLYSFGGLSLSLDNQIVGDQIPLKAKAFMVYVCRKGKPQSREKIASLLWSEYPAERAAHNLRVTLMPVRELLSNHVEISRTEIGANIWLDANVFEQTLDQLRPQINGEQPFSQADVDTLESALVMYRGDFLSHVNLADASAFDEWVSAERESLRQRYLSAGSRLMDVLATRQRYSDGIDLALQLVNADPLREDLHRRLMTLYAVSGDRTSALQGFERFQTALWDELGVEPEDETIALYERVAANQVMTLPTTDSPLPPTNLPGELAPFLGRESELAQIAALLEGKRCVTLVGTGGIGKTRLALKAAERQREAFPDGVFWVELAPLVAASAVAEAVRAALGIEDTTAGSLNEMLAAYLRDKRLLLVLDNFEHVLEAADLVEHLLRAAPALRVLVTSREPLRLYGEYSYDMPALNRGEAIDLFVDRAKAIQPRFQADDLALLDALCARLDDLPLALELAASGARTQPLSKILARLDAARLESPLRGIPERQRTLFNTIEWSYQLLTVEEQRLYRGLAYFVGTWTYEAAAAVCGEADGLDALVEKSLLRRTDDEHGEARYSMLETIRQHARLKLTEAAEDGDRLDAYLAYYVDFAETANLGLRGRDEARWSAQLKANLDNLHAALEYADAVSAALVEARLAAALGRFWNEMSLHREARLFGERALRHRDSLPSEVLAGVIAVIGFSAFLRGEPQLAEACHSEALELYEQAADLHGQAFMNMCLCAHTRNLQATLSFGRQAYAMFHAVGEISLFGAASNNLALLYCIGGAFADAEKIVRQGLAHIHGMSLFSEGMLYNSLSCILCYQGRIPESLTTIEAYFELEHRASFFDVNSLIQKAWLLVYLERLDEAQACCNAAEDIMRQAKFSFDYRGLQEVRVAIADMGNDLTAMKKCCVEAFSGINLDALPVYDMLSLSVGLSHMSWYFAKQGRLDEAWLLKAGLEQLLQRHECVLNYQHTFYLDKAAPLLANTPPPQPEHIPNNPFAYALECLARQ